MPQDTLGNHRAGRISSTEKKNIFSWNHHLPDSKNCQGQMIGLLHDKNVKKEESSIKSLSDMLTSIFLEKEMGTRLGECALLLEGLCWKREQAGI
jgi:hypothetical protein